MCAAFLSLAVLTLLCSCEEPGKSASQPKIDLPLSPGVKVASLVSGGIAGISDLVQVT